MAASCKNCRHRVVLEYGPGIAAGVRRDHCREFVTSTHSKVTGTQFEPLPCDYAMGRFCNLTSWKPTLWHQIKRALARN